MHWQLIETAPKVFEPSILVYARPYGRPMISIAHWANPKTMFSSSTEVHRNADPADYRWVFSDGFGFVRPTHWMPLPEPPITPTDNPPRKRS